MTRILLIEDTPSLREELAELLRFEGYDVETAEHGRDGIEKARATQPDLVICDLMMPVMDGYATLSALRSDKQLATVPFVCMTARSERPAMRRAMELGADDFLTKPCSADELLAAVVAGLGKRARATSESAKQLDDLRARITLSLPHEVRTPLTAILGYAEQIQDEAAGTEGARLADMADRIYHSAERLMRLMENFLLLAQLELASGDTRHERWHGIDGSVALEAVAAYQVERVCGAAGRTIDLSLDLQPVLVAITEDLLGRIIRELLDNAIKFSAPGTAIRVATAADGDLGVLRIQDEGRGMSAEEIARIGTYMQFGRDVYEQQGMGLGLTIAQRVVTLAGGTLDLASDTGAGTTVTVRFPRVEENDGVRAS